MDLWHRKRPLYQLNHNHCPSRFFILLFHGGTAAWSDYIYFKINFCTLLALCHYPVAILVALFTHFTSIGDWTRICSNSELLCSGKGATYSSMDKEFGQDQLEWQVSKQASRSVIVWAVMSFSIEGWIELKGDRLWRWILSENSKKRFQWKFPFWEVAAWAAVAANLNENRGHPILRFRVQIDFEN